MSVREEWEVRPAGLPTLHLMQVGILLYCTDWSHSAHVTLSTIGSQDRTYGMLCILN